METLQINPSVIHDKIEGEIILLNLNTGTYYQLKGEAVTVWDDIAAGASVPVLVTNLAVRYGLPVERAQESIQPFLLELQNEDIVALADAQGSETAPPVPNAETNEFHPPLLIKYTDMQSLLLLDPIHDVDTEGWPLKQRGTEA